MSKLRKCVILSGGHVSRVLHTYAHSSYAHRFSDSLLRPAVSMECSCVYLRRAFCLRAMFFNSSSVYSLEYVVFFMDTAGRALNINT
jgi:hypothetical protein